jgi:hypothetical protein
MDEIDRTNLRSGEDELWNDTILYGSEPVIRFGPYGRRTLMLMGFCVYGHYLSELSHRARPLAGVADGIRSGAHFGVLPM